MELTLFNNAEDINILCFSSFVHHILYTDLSGLILCTAGVQWSLHVVVIVLTLMSGLLSFVFVYVEEY